MNRLAIKPSVTVVIVTYFTGPLLARAIFSAQHQPHVDEIIIVDNGNWDGAVEEAMRQCARLDDVHASRMTQDTAAIRVLTGHGNVGFAKACNLGAKAANGSHLLFLNPDAVLPSGAVDQFLKDAASLERPWLMAPKLIDPDGTEQQGSRRATLTPWRAIVEATKLYRFAPRHPYFRRFNLHTEPLPTEVKPLPVVSGACFFLPSQDFLDIGGMDERYFLHVEDVDFCLRFAEAGGGVYFNPYVAVVHYKSSSRVNPVRIEARKTASMLLYFRRHFSTVYPAPFLWFVHGALWIHFGLKVGARFVQRVLGLVGLVVRYGPARAKRVRDIAAQRAPR